MTVEKIVERFKAHQKELGAYQYMIGLLMFDQEVSAAPAGVEAAATTAAVLEGRIYNLSTDENFKKDVEALMDRRDELDDVTRREAELFFREIEHYRQIPEKLIVDFGAHRTECVSVWRRAKEEKNFSLYAPYLEKSIEYIRQIYEHCAPGKPTYEALLDYTEEGMTTAYLDQFFEVMRRRLIPLIHRVRQSKTEIRSDFLGRSYAVDAQKKLSHRLMELLGMDAHRSRLYESEHPFTIAMSMDDVRITTHYYEQSVTSSMYSVVHEGGHALYEMGVDRALRDSVLSKAMIITLHESQSRFVENYIFRSREMCRFLFPELQSLYSDQLKDVTAEEWYRAVNKCAFSLIRCDADELTYPMHVLIRYELEKKLFNGELKVQNLPEAWNDLYEEYLGVRPADDAEGVMQDIHWADGMFGYFYSYALGTAYGAQMMDCIKREMDVQALLSKGEIQPLIQYLRSHVHQYGALRTPQRIIEDCFGGPFDPDHYMDYLEKKYSELYNI